MDESESHRSGEGEAFDFLFKVLQERISRPGSTQQSVASSVCDLALSKNPLTEYFLRYKDRGMVLLYPQHLLACIHAARLKIFVDGVVQYLENKSLQGPRSLDLSSTAYRELRGPGDSVCRLNSYARSGATLIDTYCRQSKTTTQSNFHEMNTKGFTSRDPMYRNRTHRNLESIAVTPSRRTDVFTATSALPRKATHASISKNSTCVRHSSNAMAAARFLPACQKQSTTPKPVAIVVLTIEQLSHFTRQRTKERYSALSLLQENALRARKNTSITCLS